MIALGPSLFDVGEGGTVAMPDRVGVYEIC